MSFVMAFLVGGSICGVAQSVYDRTKLSMAHILVLLVTLGSLLTAAGLYKPLVRVGGAGATVPVMNFGFVLTQGAIDKMEQMGTFGLLKGVFYFAGEVFVATVVVASLMALIFRPKG